MQDEQALAGGMTNAGTVVRAGATVRRPWRATTPAAQHVLERLARAAPGVAPRPLGRDDQGREVLSWVDGEVAVPPFPAWAVHESFLDSLGGLLRRIHDALRGWRAPDGLVWADELADPAGGLLAVHADICPENVVCRDGRAVALLDWEHVGLGRPLWDVAGAMAMCVPFVSEERRHRAFRDVDVLARARLLADAYGLDDAGRAALPGVLAQQREVSEGFLRRRAAEHHPAYRSWWADAARAETRHEAERAWLRAMTPELLDALRR